MRGLPRDGRTHERRRRDPSARSRFDRLFPPLLAVAWAALHLGISLVFFPVGDIGVETDFYAELGEGARQLWEGRFSVLNHPYKGPLTSLLVAGLYAIVHPLGGDWYRAGVLLNALCAVAALALTYRLVLATFGRPTAVLTTLSAALVYELFAQAHKASSDVLFLLLFTATTWLVVRALWGGKHRGRGDEAISLPGLAAAGAAAGLAYLTRYNGMVLPIAASAAVLLAAPRSVPRRRRLAGCAVLVGAMAAVALPWFAVNVAETGRPFSTRNLQNIFVEELGEAPEDGGGPTTLLEIVRRDPAGAAGRYARNLALHLWLDLTTTLTPAAILLFGLGLVSLALGRPDRRQTAFLLFPLCYFLAMATVYHQPRFSLPLVAGYWSVGWAWLTGRWGPWGRTGRTGTVASRMAAALLVLAVFGLLARDVIRTERLYHQRRPLAVLPAARFLAARAAEQGRREAAPAPAAVLARKPHVPFYADLPYAPYPPRLESRADLLAAARAHQARWIVWGDIERLHYRWERWLGELHRVPGIEIVYDEPAVRIYELDLGRLAAGPEDAQAARLAEQEARVSADAGRSAEEAAAAAAAVGRRWADLGEWEPAAAAFARALLAAERAEAAGEIEAPPAGAGVGDAHPCGLRVELAWALAHLRRWEEIRGRLEPRAGGAGRPLQRSEGEAGAVDRDCPPDLAAATHDLLGRAYLNLGDRAAAIGQLETALAGYEATGSTAPAATVRRALEGLR